MDSSLVQVQTLRGNGGHEAALNEVQAAVASFNKANPKADHIVVDVDLIAPNTKGMQWQLALLAVVARVNEVSMIRLNVHNARVALCGPKKAIAAAQLAYSESFNQYVTLVANSYNPAKDGNRVGFTNGFLCGCPAGLQDARKIKATLAYGVGTLFTFPAPGTGVSYSAGHKAALILITPAKAKAPRSARKPATSVVPVAAPVEQPSEEQEAIAS